MHQLWNGKIVRIDFDDIWQKYSKYPRIEFVCFSFCVGLSFLSTSSFKPDTENNVNFEAVSSKHANFDKMQFFLNIHLLFGTHNLQTFKHNTLSNELLLMQFYFLIFVLNCITGSDENYASHCSKISQIHQQPVGAILHPTFIRKLCYKLLNIVTFSLIQIFGQNFVFFTERRHVQLTGSVTHNFQNPCYFLCPVWKTKSW